MNFKFKFDIFSPHSLGIEPFFLFISRISCKILSRKIKILRFCGKFKHKPSILLNSPFFDEPSGQKEIRKTKVLKQWLRYCDIEVTNFMQRSLEAPHDRQI
jgi:hypothetical protein